MAISSVQLPLSRASAPKSVYTNSTIAARRRVILADFLDLQGSMSLLTVVMRPIVWLPLSYVLV